MSRVIEAEYIAAENILKLSAPLQGVEDHARLEVEIKQTVGPRTEQPWMKLAGSLNTEDGRVVAKAIRDGFGETRLKFEVLAIEAAALVMPLSSRRLDCCALRAASSAAAVE